MFFVKREVTHVYIYVYISISNTGHALEAARVPYAAIWTLGTLREKSRRAAVGVLGGGGGHSNRKVLGINNMYIYIYILFPFIYIYI